MNTNKLTFAAIAAIAVALAMAVSPAFMTSASAKISPVTTDVSCTNGGGNQPGGQQPSCQGAGLTQETETENQNPAGSAPPGQNK